jgi:hypothetical protein
VSDVCVAFTSDIFADMARLGKVSITVGGKTASHPAYISEENHFDVVLGRSWIEKMGVK